MKTETISHVADFVKGSLLTAAYYGGIYFLTEHLHKKYPSNGAPSEAVFVSLGLLILSLVMFVYCVIRLLKGDSSKIGAVAVHTIVLIGIVSYFNLR